MQYVTLNNGVKMPQLGLGVLCIDDLTECERVVSEALEVGYRLIDTAAGYQNEQAVGAAIKASGLDREDIFVTSKLWVPDYSYEGAKRGFDESRQRLGVDYLDLYLIHLPLNNYFGAWRALEELYQAGHVRAIGVSNFDSVRIADISHFSEVTPAVNQIEINPFHQRVDEISYMKGKGIQPQAWASFAEGANDIFNSPILVEIGEKYGKSPAQVILRWQMQEGIVAIPKSVRRERMEQNFDIFDFELSAEDIASVKTLNTDQSLIFDPRKVEHVEGLLTRFNL